MLLNTFSIKTYGLQITAILGNRRKGSKKDRMHKKIIQDKKGKKPIEERQYFLSGPRK